MLPKFGYLHVKETENRVVCTIERAPQRGDSRGPGWWSWVETGWSGPHPSLEAAHAAKHLKATD